MRRPLISEGCLKLARDPFLNKILRRCGTYFHAADLFYQELWRQRLANMGFRVVSVNKLPYHHVWDIRLFGTLTAQLYLLGRPVPAKWALDPDLLPKQLKSEMRRLAREMGPPIPSDCLSVVKSGAYFRVNFIWPPGQPGKWLKQEKPAEAFSFLIRPWLRKNRN